jgi:hypothetical protein
MQSLFEALELLIRTADFAVLRRRQLSAQRQVQGRPDSEEDHDDRMNARAARPLRATPSAPERRDRESAQVGQIYFGDQAGKWVRFESGLTAGSRHRTRRSSAAKLPHVMPAFEPERSERETATYS